MKDQLLWKDYKDIAIQIEFKGEGFLTGRDMGIIPYRKKLFGEEQYGVQGERSRRRR